MINLNQNRACFVIVLLLSTFLFTVGVSANTGDNSLVFISGSIVFDRDGSGSVTPADSALEGVTVSLLSESGDVLDSQATDEYGGYLFSGLDLGTYNIEVNTDSLPDGVSNSASITPELPVTLVEGDSSVANHNFGYVSTLSIGDLVFLDVLGTAEGVQNVGDVPLAGVTVELYSVDMNNDLVASTITNDEGRYQFSNLEPGNYYISFIIPDTLREQLLADGVISADDGLAFADGGVGGNNELDSDVASASLDEDGSNIGQTSVISLQPGGGNNFSFDAGISIESNIPLAVQTNGMTAVTSTTLIFIFTLFGLLATTSIATRK